MKKKAIITICVVMVAIIGLGAAGAAQWSGKNKAAHRIDYVRMKLTETLDLTDTQKATLNRMTEEILAQHGEMQASRAEMKKRMFQVLNQEEVTADDLTQLFEEKRPHIEQMMQLVAGNIADFHSILTPEQRARLIEEIKNHGSGCRFGR